MQEQTVRNRLSNFSGKETIPLRVRRAFGSARRAWAHAPIRACVGRVGLVDVPRPFFLVYTDV